MATSRFVDAHPSIIEGMAGEGTERPAIPAHDGRNELGDDHRSGWRQDIERGAEGESHAETADEHVRSRSGRNAAAAERGQRVLRAVLVARHERLVVGEEQKFAVTTLERQHRAVGSRRLVDENPGFHSTLSRKPRPG